MLSFLMSSDLTCFGNELRPKSLHCNCRARSCILATVLDALPESYQTFASTWRLVTEDRPDVVKYDTLVNKLLQEAQSRQNKARQRAVNQAFVAAQQRGSGKAANFNASSPISR